MSVYTSLCISRHSALELYYKAINHKEPSNEDLENFLEEYCLTENNYNCGVHEDYEDDYTIRSLFDEKFTRVDSEPFTFAHLKRKLSWSDFCEITGTDYYCLNEGHEIKPEEIFYITKENIEKFNL